MIRSRPSTPEYRAGHEAIFGPADRVYAMVEEGKQAGAVPWSPSYEIRERVKAVLRVHGITRTETMRETLERRHRAEL